jgi:glycogen debranching enzyme
MDLHSLETLSALPGDDPAPIARRRHRVASRMLELMYDEDAGAFYDVCEPGANKLRINTPTIFFPLAIQEIGTGIAQRVLDMHFNKEDEFGAPFPIPSLDLRDPAFFAGNTPFIWRGPTWAFTNWFLYHALKNRGHDAQAGQLRQSLGRLIQKSGFREYYNPFTGEGFGAEAFTWSGLFIDMT